MERLSIDEAIAHAREKAKEQRYYANFEKRGSMVQSCLQCAEEHEQLAEWLEELKELRKIKEDYAKGMQTSYATFMYKKAIDDFAKWLVEHKIVDEDSMQEIIIDFNEEQLKAGGENESK